jgi:hypothetical protein
MKTKKRLPWLVANCAIELNLGVLSSRTKTKKCTLMVAILFATGIKNHLIVQTVPLNLLWNKNLSNRNVLVVLHVATLPVLNKRKISSQIHTLLLGHLQTRTVLSMTRLIPPLITSWSQSRSQSRNSSRNQKRKWTGDPML